MRRFSLNQFLFLSCFAFVLTGSILLTSVYAQRGSSNAAPSAVRTGDLKKLDNEANKIETEFLKNAYDISSKYEKAGDLERAIEYLEAMLKINPDLPGAEDKIKELQEDIMTANEFDFKMEVAQTWGNPVAFVRAGKPFRLQAAGSYKLTLSEVMSPEGFPESNIQRDLVDDIAPGRLIGMIIPRQGPAANGGGEDDGPKPIDIGSDKEINPKETGFLFLKINTPATARVSGALKVQLSGYVLAPDGRNVGK
ncbi:tetratricopeptide repeat protein [bacterium]|nr:tetratricopeptide repeat protein [bacterium]